jgi:protein gp37
MHKSKIEWCDSSWNPVRTVDNVFYCSKVSAGCTHCYAEIVSAWIARMNGLKPEPYTARKQYPEMKLDRKMLASWRNMTKTKKNFVSSLSDIFGEFVPEEMIFEILDAMYLAHRQVWQILTKRTQRACTIINKWLDKHMLPKLPEHMWIGTSVEDQETFDQRVMWLLLIPAAVRWLSVEPLLNRIDMTDCGYPHPQLGIGHHNPLSGANDLLEAYLPNAKIHWVVVGGESGKDHRPMEQQWVRNIKAQCKQYEVPFFFKQWGGKKKDESPPVLDGKEYKEFPVTRLTPAA